MHRSRRAIYNTYCDTKVFELLSENVFLLVFLFHKVLLQNGSSELRTNRNSIVFLSYIFSLQNQKSTDKKKCMQRTRFLLQEAISFSRIAGRLWLMFQDIIWNSNSAF